MEEKTTNELFSKRPPHRCLLLVGSVVAVAAAVSGSLPGWSPNGQWQAGNVFDLPDMVGANYFRFLPWTRKPSAAGSTTGSSAASSARPAESMDCTQNFPGVGSDRTVFSVRRSVCGNSANSAAARPAAPPQAVLGVTSEQDRCTQTVEGVGPDGQVFAVRKNICAGAAEEATEVRGAPVRPPPPQLLPAQHSGLPAAAVSTAPALSTATAAKSSVPATSAAPTLASLTRPTTAPGHPTSPASPNCFQTVEVSHLFMFKMESLAKF